MSRTIWVYSEQELSPRAADVIAHIKNETGFADVRFKHVGSGVITGGKILCFGSGRPEGVWDGVEFIHTYSIAQVMSKANAMTAVSAAFKLYFGEKHEVPEEIRPWGYLPHNNHARAKFDFSKPVAIDIETDGNLGNTHTPEDVNIISVALYQPGAGPITFCIRDSETGGTKPWDAKVIQGFGQWLAQFDYGIYHNGKFDIRVMNRVFRVQLKNSFDTMLAHHVLNHAAGEHGLKALAQRYLGAPDWEGDIKKYTKGGGHYELIPSEKLVEYNGWDVYWTYQLFELFAPQIEADDDNMKAFMVEMTWAELLLDIENNGIPFDYTAAKSLADEQQQIMEVRRSNMRNMVNEPEFNPGSWQQVKRVLKDVFNETVASTNEETITALKDDTFDPELALFCTYLIEYRKASKIKGTYAEGWHSFARNGRVHPTFLVHGTSTGRLSSTQPNGQNMPRDKSIRKIVSVNGINYY